PPRKSGGYEMHAPTPPPGGPVDAKTAAALHTEPFPCHSSFPDGSLEIFPAIRDLALRIWSRDWRIICLTSLLAGLLPLITPLITQNVFSSIIPIYDRQALGTVAQVMLVSAFASATVSFVRAVSCIRLKNRLGNMLEAALWSRLLSLPAAFFRNYQTGDLINRLQGAASISGVFEVAFIQMVFGFFGSFFSLLLMFHYSILLTFWALLIWAIYLVLVAIVYSRALQFQRKAIQAANRTSARALELIGGIPVFRLRAAEVQAFWLWAKAFGEGWQWTLALRRLGNRIAVLNVIQPIILSMVVYHAVDEIFRSGFPLTMPEFLAFQGLYAGFNATLLPFAQSVASIFSLAPQMENLRPIMETLPEAGIDKVDAGALSGLVEVKNLRFSYAQSARPAIRDVSFRIQPGSTVALVGHSGCGKSTLVRLLLGFESPHQGGVYYDGQDLAAFNPESVRRQIGVVLQSGRIMAGEIFANIVGSLPLTMDDAWEAARMVGIADDIERMPMGMNTIVSEGGGNLSGGQRQRLLIARAIVHRPRVVILDEATSALDNLAQETVAKSLAALRATRILIAHRLSTVRSADRIYVMNEGEIVEEGTYADLITLDGWFSRLAKRQTT
ncbi:MAG: ATP-binding cassette domain-containing protein, partial [Planctomycetes bacterium]|nr:ATP-binding cassette domain-containing protein [Planctomycetota bacterium]